MNSYKDPRIRIYNQTNIGLTKSLNKGIKVAKGEFIARLDADERALPTRFEKQIDIINKDPEMGVIGSYCMNFYNINKKFSKIISLPIDDHNIRKTLIWNNPFIHGSVMIRKKAIETVGYYNESFRYIQDYELWGRIAKLYKFQNLPNVLIKRMVTSSSISYNPMIMEERALFAVKAQFSVLKHLNVPFFYYIYLLKRIARYILYRLRITNFPKDSK